MSIEIAIKHQLGAFAIDAKFASAGRLTVLFGASGAGKSTIINTIAGLTQPNVGRIIVDGAVLLDTAKGIDMAAHQRRIGYVFQEPRLFPHLSVAQNLSYGKWFAREPVQSRQLAHVIALLGLGKLMSRMPNSLSGGEKQRVAIGRALLSNPKLLLMDEPLAALDQPRKAEIMPYIESLRDETNIPIIYVSHSVAEVARLATDIAIIANGKVMATGATHEIMQRPDFMPLGESDEVGSVLTMAVASYNPDFDMTLISSPVGEIQIQGRVGEIGKSVRLRLRARDIIIATQKPKGLSALNVLSGKISSMENNGPLVMVKIDCAGSPVLARITRQSAVALKLKIQMPVCAIVKTASLDAVGKFGA